MTTEVQLMREEISLQHEEICRLNRNIDKLNADLRKRDKQIKELKTRLVKYETPDKNSGNSSTPPSKETFKDENSSRTKTLRKSKKPGGQLGHEGNTLKMTDTPDETEDVQAPFIATKSRGIFI